VESLNRQAVMDVELVSNLFLLDYTAALLLLYCCFTCALLLLGE
jgi:hypothetical protein